MATPKIIWEDEAIRLLETRDRYTRNAVREEFRREPQRDAVEYDPAQHAFVTPVFNRRFGVVWQLDEPRQCALVTAVVALTVDLDEFRTPDRQEQLKDYVQRAVHSESKGQALA